VKLQILQVPDCPNVALLRQRLDEALAHTDLAVTVRVVEDGEEAAALGMTGSPTLLVDGVDPFAEPGRTPSISCRLYRDVEGRVSGAPTVAALRRALRTGDRDSSLAAPTLPAWRARAVPADPAERALHHAVLRAFATAGAAPGRATLEQLAAPFAVPAVELLHRLHERDVIRLGPDGNIRSAYPFSAVPTPHRVQLAGGPNIYAMCVIDALGIPAMLATDAVITTTSPAGGPPITITSTAGRTVWDPPAAVVFAAASAGAGPSAEVCCEHLNAFANRATGLEWAATHPDVPGRFVDGAEADRLGRSIFGDLLSS
jgi:hypothetical protein